MDHSISHSLPIEPATLVARRGFERLRSVQKTLGSRTPNQMPRPFGPLSIWALHLWLQCALHLPRFPRGKCSQFTMMLSMDTLLKMGKMKDMFSSANGTLLKCSQGRANVRAAPNQHRGHAQHVGLLGSCRQRLRLGVSLAPVSVETRKLNPKMSLAGRLPCQDGSFGEDRLESSM